MSASAAENTVTIVFGYDELNSLLANANAVYFYNGSSYAVSQVSDFSSTYSSLFNTSGPVYGYSCSSSQQFDYMTLELVMPYEAKAINASITVFTVGQHVDSNTLNPFGVGFLDVNNLPSAFTSISSSFSNSDPYSTGIYSESFAWSGNLDISGLYADTYCFNGLGGPCNFGISYFSLTYSESEFAEIEKQLEATNTKLQKINDDMGVITYVMGELNKELKEEINKQTEQSKQNTQDIIDNQKENTQDIIDNQDKNTQDIIDNDQKLWDDTYNPSDEEVSDMQDSISDISDELKEKLGLFTFIDDTLSQFFDLLDPAQVSSTNMTFPSLSITVQGESYQFVEETDYDISSLESIEGFKPLFTALHFFSAAIIYWALIAYIQKVFKRIFASGSGDEQ